MIIMLLSFWVIGVPLGYILTFTDRLLPAMGAAGFWIGLIAGLSHAAFWLFIRLIWISRKDHNSLPLDIDKMKPDQI
jgi:MATE family multidrug resistance protein